MTYNNAKLMKTCFVNKFNCFVTIKSVFHFAGGLMFKVTVNGCEDEFTVQEWECSRFTY